MRRASDSVLTIFAVFSITMAENATKGERVISLPNEMCEPRSALVTVGMHAGDYYPQMISLRRCAGACVEDFRTCMPTKTNVIHLNAMNQFTRENETLMFENHTSCACNCVHDSTVCAHTQIWSEAQCSCSCSNLTAHSNCPSNYMWNHNDCQTNADGD